MKKLLLSFSLASLFLFAAPVLTLAQATPATGQTAATGQQAPSTRPPSDFGYASPVGRDTTLISFINRLIKLALGVVGAILLAMFVYGGGMWMMPGDAKNVDNAKTILKNAVIGMAIVTLSYTLVTALFTFGNQVIQPPAAEETTPTDAVVAP